MTREEIENRLAELGNEIILLRQAVEEDLTTTPPNQRLELKLGERYYYIESDGDIHSCKWWKEKCDLDRFAIGNVFLTKDAAEYAAEYCKVLAEMREWAGKWDDLWHITYRDGDIEPSPIFMGNEISHGDIRFATEADAKNCIKAVGKDRLIKYYFGIVNNKIPMPDCCCCSS